MLGTSEIRAPRTKYPSGSGRPSAPVWVRSAALPLVGLAVLAAGIEIFSRSGVIDSRFLPSLGQVVQRVGTLPFDARFPVDLGTTILTFVLGMVLAILLGSTAGIAVGLSEIAYRSSRTVVELIRPVPPVALIPLAIIVLGSTLQMKLSLVLFAAIWPILFNAMYGVHSVDPLAREMARSFGKSRFAVIRTVVIPAAMPLIWTGIRMSTTIAMVVVITVELIAGSNDGIGAFIARARSASQPVDAYAAVLVAGLLGLTVNQGMAAIERVAFRWNNNQERV